MSKVEEAITEHWGERCKDKEPGCPCCDAWAEYDALQSREDNLRQERNKLDAMAKGEA